LDSFDRGNFVQGLSRHDRRRRSHNADHIKHHHNLFF
jgi:hypothetical protein